jgi:rod shape-determining protein MreD
VLPAVLIAIDEWLQWRVAKSLDAAPPFVRMVPTRVISVCLFPAFAWIVSRIDAWRLGR